MSWSSRKKQEEIFCTVYFAWAWKCILAAISSGVDISEVPGHHLLQQTSAITSPSSQKLLYRLVSHELTAYLSIFNLF